MLFLPGERAQAKKLGLTCYETGRPCKRGHIAPRWTANGICIECRSEARSSEDPNKPRCVVQGCDRQVCAKGYCSAHYRRWKQGRDIGGSPIRQQHSREALELLFNARDITRTKDGLCSCLSCEHRPVAQAFCSRHYQIFVDAGLLKTSRTPKTKFVLDDLRDHASALGGDCLSLEYTSCNDVYKWRCALGHEWSARWSHLKHSRSWCPQCSGPRTERVCRRILELMFGAGFPKGRPEWLRTSSRRRLELDGYNEELSLAFEYQGDQHYSTVGKFFTEAMVASIQDRDALKRRACWERGVGLIVVPTVPCDSSDELLINQVELAVISANVPIPKSWRSKRPREIPKEWTLPAPTALPSSMLEYARARGGRCLSLEYIGADKKYEWECSEGHRWSVRWDFMAKGRNGGSWCRKCAYKTNGMRQKGVPTGRVTARRPERVVVEAERIANLWYDPNVSLEAIKADAKICITTIYNVLGPRRRGYQRSVCAAGGAPAENARSEQWGRDTGAYQIHNQQ